MKPVLFPFTHIDELTLDAISNCFRPLVVYRPAEGSLTSRIQHWEREGRLELRTPVAGDEQRLAHRMAEYQAWSRNHQGAMAAFKLIPDQIPLWSDASVSRIRSQIRDLSNPVPDNESQESKPVDALFQARLFLSLAQVFDADNDSVAADVRRVEALQQNVLSDLLGGGTPETRQHSAPLDAGGHMPAERLAAWIRLWQQAPGDGRLFVTPSRTVIEHLAERTPGLEVLGRWSAAICHSPGTTEAEAYRQHLATCIHRLACEAAPDQAEFSRQVSQSDSPHRAQWTLYCTRGQTPALFFDPAGAAGGQKPRQPTDSASQEVTLIAWVQC